MILFSFLFQEKQTLEKDSERKLMDEKENSVKCKYQFLGGNFYSGYIFKFYSLFQ